MNWPTTEVYFLWLWKLGLFHVGALRCLWIAVKGVVRVTCHSRKWTLQMEKGKKGGAKRALGVMSEDLLCDVDNGMRVHLWCCSLSENWAQWSHGTPMNFWKWGNNMLVNTDHARGFIMHLCIGAFCIDSCTHVYVHACVDAHHMCEYVFVSVYMHEYLHWCGCTYACIHRKVWCTCVWYTCAYACVNVLMYMHVSTDVDLDLQAWMCTHVHVCIEVGESVYACVYV